MNDPLAPKPGIILAEEQRLAWLRLIRSENVGPTTFIELIKRFGTASNALDALPDLATRGRGKTIKVATEADAMRELERIGSISAELVCLGEPAYPPALRAADGSPPVLTVRGNTEILTRNSVAFVGARNASMAGIKLTKQLAREVGEGGYAIVSGFARGIDSAAHSAALESGTVAVFAGGIDHIYPPENKGFDDRIVGADGAIVSEMPFGWRPRAQEFPRRNRIVAGMVLGLVVVEAARRSGSLISARLANEMGRLVFAVPGSPLDPRSEGTNHLIKNGAQLITSAKDVLETLQPISEKPIQADYSLDETDEETDFSSEPTQTERERLLSALGHTPSDVDELIRFTGIQPGNMQLLLLELDLAGKLERLTGNRVSLI